MVWFYFPVQSWMTLWYQLVKFLDPLEKFSMSPSDLKVEGKVIPPNAMVSLNGMLQTSAEVIVAEFKYPSGSCVRGDGFETWHRSAKGPPAQYQFPHQTSEWNHTTVTEPPWPWPWHDKGEPVQSPALPGWWPLPQPPTTLLPAHSFVISQDRALLRLLIHCNSIPRNPSHLISHLA